MISGSARGASTFTEHRHSKSPRLCTLNNPGGFADSLRDWGIELDTDPSGADSLYVRGCNSHTEFDGATSIATNGRIRISGLQADSLKESFSRLITEIVVRSTTIVMTMSGF